MDRISCSFRIASEGRLLFDVINKNTGHGNVSRDRRRFFDLKGFQVVLVLARGFPHTLASAKAFASCLNQKATGYERTRDRLKDVSG